jgi:restriction system protein
VALCTSRLGRTLSWTSCGWRAGTTIPCAVAAGSLELHGAWFGIGNGELQLLGRDGTFETVAWSSAKEHNCRGLIGAIVEHYRKGRAITQEAMAQALGILQSAYSRLEQGQSGMSVAQLRTHLQWLRGEDGVVSPEQAEQVMAKVLSAILEVEGYRFSANKTERHLDFHALRPGDERSSPVSISVEYRHHMEGQALSSAAVQVMLNSALGRGLDRVMLIARHGFTNEALEMAQRAAPVSLELLTLDDLQARVDRIELGALEASEKVQMAVRTLAHELAILVARHPSVLDQLEWRDLERMVARILEGLGFRATLTRPGKDGGKDVIAECCVHEGPRSYFIELKHWASGKRVGPASVTHFVKVVMAEQRDGGIFLSTSGYAKNAFASVTEIVRERIRFGGRAKIVSLAKTYERAGLGLWSAPAVLPEVLFEETD